MPHEVVKISLALGCCSRLISLLLAGLVRPLLKLLVLIASRHDPEFPLCVGNPYLFLLLSQDLIELREVGAEPGELVWAVFPVHHDLLCFRCMCRPFG